MVNRPLDRIKRLSMEVLSKYRNKFSTDFSTNKKILEQVSIIRSKGLKNEIAGYITRLLKKQQRLEQTKEQAKTQAELKNTQDSSEEQTGQNTLENSGSVNLDSETKTIQIPNPE